MTTSADKDSMERPGKLSKDNPPLTEPCKASVFSLSEADMVAVASICRSDEIPGSFKLVEKVPVSVFASDASTARERLKADGKSWVNGSGSWKDVPRSKDHFGLPVEEYLNATLPSLKLDDCDTSGPSKADTIVSSEKTEVSEPATLLSELIETLLDRVKTAR